MKKTVFLLAAMGIMSFTGAVAQTTQTPANIPNAPFYSVTENKSHYSPGEIATMSVSTLLKPSTIEADVYSRGVFLRAYTATPTVTGASSSATFQFGSETEDFQGYYIDLKALNGSTILGEQGASIDVSSEWSVYPRQCWFINYTQWGSYTPTMIGTPEGDVDNLMTMKCNNLQVYNTLYRWHQPIPSDGSDVFVNGDGMTIDNSLVRRGVDEGHKKAMKSLLYFPIYAANSGIAPNFTQDGTGVQLSWAMFKDNCGATNSCTVDDTLKFSTNISYMNPQNPAWQKYWAYQLNRAKKKLHIDFAFIDTYGGPLPAVWDGSGARIIQDKMFSSFLAGVSQYTNLTGVVNPAGTYNLYDLVSANLTNYHFVENWNNPTDIADFTGFLSDSLNVWSWSNRKPYSVGIDRDMGMNKGIAAQSKCDMNGGSEKCYFNTPGVLYQEAAMLAAGSHHAWFVSGQMTQGDGYRLISNDDYPIGKTLYIPNDLRLAEYIYQNFGVAYEKLLRLNVSKSPLTAPQITSGLGGTAYATSGVTAGQVWGYQMQRSGFEIAHFLNYSTMTTANFTDVNDNAGTAVAPTTFTNMTAKMYYTAGATIGDLYFASPDYIGGKSVKLDYTTGTDDGGSFVTFTLPTLSYWSMTWLEENVASSDYAN